MMSHAALPPFVTTYPHNIYAIDTGYHMAQHDALYAVVDAGEVALIDCGTNHSVPHIEAFLAALDLPPTAVKWQILTHIHLDHAGGAGLVMQRFPQAKLLVHPRGAPHIANPAKLVSATEAVYGKADTQRLYGTILPIDAQRIVQTHDGISVSLGKRAFWCMDAPGHAKHHIAIRDSVSGGFFTGDTFGLSYREFDRDGQQFIFPTTTPSQFAPDDLIATQTRILSYNPKQLYLTHYGAVNVNPQTGSEQARLIQQLAKLAQNAASSIDTPQNAHQKLCVAMSALLQDEAQRNNWASPDTVLARFAMDIDLNAQGLLDWVARARAGKA